MNDSSKVNIWKNEEGAYCPFRGFLEEYEEWRTGEEYEGRMGADRPTPAPYESFETAKSLAEL